VISKEGRIIAESNNKVILNSDPTAHAEILAIREAAGFLRTHDLDGCILYTSCEPCPMCLGAIYWSGIKRVVYASDRRDAAIAGFDDEMIYNEISLDPSMRRITFEQIIDTEAKEVFRNGIIMTEKPHIRTVPELMRLEREFFTRDVLDVAPGLLSKMLAIKSINGNIRKYYIQKPKPIAAQTTKPAMPAGDEPENRNNVP